MSYYDPPAPSPLDRVRDLTDQLAELARRVRAAVADAVAETLARIARDATERILRPVVIEPARSWQRDTDTDPWDDESTYRNSSIPEPHREGSTLGRALTAGLAAAGWWARRGSPLSALGAGVTVAAAIASSGYLGRTGRAVVAAMTDLLAVAAPLARGGERGHRRD